MAVGLFSYGGWNNIDLGYVANISAASDDPTGVYYLQVDGVSTGSPMPGWTQNPSDPAYLPWTAGLFTAGNATSFSDGSHVYELRQGSTTGPLVGGSLTLTWVTGGAHPLFQAVPAPALTATAVYNPLAGYNDIRLDWTASVSIEPYFPHICYTVERDIGQISSGYYGGPFDTLTFTDPNVPVGESRTYRVRGSEPLIGGGYWSDWVTILNSVEIPGVAVTHAAWGVLAK